MYARRKSAQERCIPSNLSSEKHMQSNSTQQTDICGQISPQRDMYAVAVKSYPRFVMTLSSVSSCTGDISAPSWPETIQNIHPPPWHSEHVHCCASVSRGGCPLRLIPERADKISSGGTSSTMRSSSHANPDNTLSSNSASSSKPAFISAMSACHKKTPIRGSA